MKNQIIAEALKYNIPYHLFFNEAEAFCKWLFVGDGDFKEPFFENTIRLERYKPVNIHPQQCISEINMITAWAQHVESCAPSAVIFHVSRCGSTLATQLLGEDPENIVLSEVPFFDELIQWKTKTAPNDEAGLPELLKAAITFYTAKRTPAQKRSFIKTDSWHIFFYPLYRKLFPTTPFIFLYRRPDEVIRSHQKKRGMHMVPGLLPPEIFGFTSTDILTIPFDEYPAKVLEKYFEHFLHITKTDPLAYPINYSEGGMAMVEKIATVAGFTITGDLREVMNNRMGFHAKNPGEVFSEEGVKWESAGSMEKVMGLYGEMGETAKENLL